MLHYNDPTNLEELTADALQAFDGQAIYLSTHDVVYPIKVKLNPGSDRLFVMLNGGVRRQTTSLPFFARWNWGKVLNGHVIAVCDPTLYLHEKLRLGWFIGTSAASALPGVIEIAEHVARHLDLPAERTIFYGSSGGGFAAISAACRIRQGRAIAVNPQIDITNYYPKAIADLKRALGGNDSFELVCRDERRIRLIASIDEARRSGMNMRCAIYQNELDEFHYRNHFLALSTALGVPASGGLSPEGDILGVVYSGPEGHAGEPPEVVRNLLATGIPYLLAGS